MDFNSCSMEYDTIQAAWLDPCAPNTGSVPQPHSARRLQAVLRHLPSAPWFQRHSFLLGCMGRS